MAQISKSFLYFSYQDQQTDSTGRPCSSPGGTAGLAPPACASWPVDSQMSLMPSLVWLQKYQVLCCHFRNEK